MRICHVTPHLPPDQSANALLPVHLGEWARDAGDSVSYVSHPPRTTGTSTLPGPVVQVPRVPAGPGLARVMKLTSLVAAQRIARIARAAIRDADLVHIHSNGLIAEVCAGVADWYGKPTVLTLYGTEIWHYQPQRFMPDLFTRAYFHAAHVTFYSQGLSDYASNLGLSRPETSVVYPPVADRFQHHDAAMEGAERGLLGIFNRHLLINVKRLHPLAGQRYLIEAMREIVRAHPDTRLVICGMGPLLQELKDLSRAMGVDSHVIFAGLVDNQTIARYCAAADLFVLPSVLEACPTVALEALACGTPVVGADNPGCVELNGLFGPDVTLVPKEQPLELAAKIVEFLANKRRTSPSTAEVIHRTFRPAAVASQFRHIYQRALGTRRGDST